jgi:hypothetical protein
MWTELQTGRQGQRGVIRLMKDLEYTGATSMKNQDEGLFYRSRDSLCTFICIYIFIQHHKCRLSQVTSGVLTCSPYLVHMVHMGKEPDFHA